MPAVVTVLVAPLVAPVPPELAVSVVRLAVAVLVVTSAPARRTVVSLLPPAPPRSS
ncbi:hypothetical protein [Herbiconiux daphne]|uniref:Secreted protein n=1 Tax=Herbiconiux daphne TaxID=2970914 RepID=A0ABT2GW11_9MICO|nr:hypothetical protein [Herbiconiux daphne]MCS5732139.1 hypothetical protein [Herbiconiux daphne]